jgi:inosine/xanthosine triphosphatase
MRIIIASTRAPKINGVKRAIERLMPLIIPEQLPVHVESVEAVSGISEMPLTLDETIRGAKNRAANAFRRSADEQVISIGVEGGLFIMDGVTYLQSWSCAFNGVAFHLGSSGAIALPKQLSDAVIEEGMELSAAIDRFSSLSDVRSKQGTYGILTDDLVTREDSFELATLFALMPFFNRKFTPSAGNTELTKR